MIKNIKNNRLKIGNNCKISDNAIVAFSENGKGSITIKDRVRIDDNVVLRTCGGHIIIDDYVTIARDTIIYAGGNVNIDKHCLISPRVQIYAQNHGLDRDCLIRQQEQSMYGIWIGYDCWIGAGAIITDKTIISHGCMLGAGSVLTKNIDTAYQIWAGNPAKFIRDRI